jgi:hypothetical protein
MRFARIVVCVLLVEAGCGRLQFDPIDGRTAVGDGVAQDDSDSGSACATAVGGAAGVWTLDAADVNGTVVRDRSGFGRDGTLVGTPTPVTTAGRVGEALDFAGTNLSYVNVPNVPLDVTPGTVTSVSLWFWTDDTNVDEALACIPTGPTTGPPRYSLWLTHDGGTTSLCINTGEGDCWGLDLPSTIFGRWVHVVVEWVNGPTIGGQLYVDGVAATMSCRFGTCNNSRTTQSPFSIACSDAGYAWHGRLDDVRLFSRALSADEVTRLHECAP